MFKIKLLKLFYICYNFRLYSVLAVIYYTSITHSYALALSIFSIAQVSQAIFEIPTGYYSDKYGRSRCLKLGTLASLLSVLGYAIGQNYWMLAAGALFEGLTQAAFSGNNDAFLYEVLKENGKKKNYSQEFGRVNSWLELSGFVSGIIGGLLAIKSLRILFWLSAIPRLLGVMVGWGIREPKVRRKTMPSITGHVKEALLTYKKNLKIRLVSLAGIIHFAIGESTWSFQGAFYNLFLPVWLTSLVMSINYLTSTISFRLGGRIIEKYGAAKTLFCSEIFGRGLYLLALVLPSAASPFLMATASITYGSSTVAKSTLLQEEFTNRQRAIIASINSFVGNCLYAIVAVLFGILADKYGITKSLLLGQICLLSTVFIYGKLLLIKNTEIDVD